ncbi:hypothetical protein ACTXT7_002462 [Hymenolepis weldensis]
MSPRDLTLISSSKLGSARGTLGLPWGTCGIPGSPPSLSTAAAAESAAERLEDHFRRNRSQRRERALKMSSGQPAWSEEEFLALAPLFHAIWADPSIQTAFNRRSLLITEDFAEHLRTNLPLRSENTRYYLNRLNQIAIPNYVPTNEDIVWSRRPTDSIIEEDIHVHGTSLLFVDVGGQTKERRKWCQTFDGMNSILFLVGSSHYDELYLDRVTGEYRNKLREAMTVFEGLINFESFRRVSIIIFFNKSDLLKEKIEARCSGIRAHFSEFPENADEFNLVAVQNFLVESFASLVDPIVYSSTTEPTPVSSPINQNRFSWFQRRSAEVQQTGMGRSASLNINCSRGTTLRDRVPRKRTIYRHFTTAVDKKNIQMVFNAMQDTILQNNLRRLMLN